MLENHSVDFVVCPENVLAYDAAMKLADGAPHYSPLVLVGPEGVGKSMLLDTLHAKLEEETSGEVIHVTAEELLNEYVASINNKNQSEWRNRYRTATALLIDDCHFFANKLGVREQPALVLEALIPSGAKVALAFERLPAEPDGERDKFEAIVAGGLVCNMYMPSAEGRARILAAHYAANQLVLPQSVIEAIAGLEFSSLRDYFGASIRVRAAAELRGVEADADLVNQIFGTRGH